MAGEIPPGSGSPGAGESISKESPEIRHEIDALEANFRGKISDLETRLPDITDAGKFPDSNELLTKIKADTEAFSERIKKDAAGATRDVASGDDLTEAKQALGKSERELQKVEALCYVEQLIDRADRLANTTDYTISPTAKQQLERLINGTNRNDLGALVVNKNIIKSNPGANLDSVKRFKETISNRIDKIEKAILLDDLELNKYLVKISQALTDVGNNRALVGSQENDRAEELKEIRYGPTGMAAAFTRLDSETNMDRAREIHGEIKAQRELWLTTLREISARFNESETAGEAAETGPKVSNAEILEKGRVLGCLATDPSPGVDAAFHKKVAERLEHLRAEGLTVHPDQVKRVRQLVAERIITKFQDRLAKEPELADRLRSYTELYQNNPDNAQAVIDKMLGELEASDKAEGIKSFDGLVRDAVATAAVNEFITDIEKTVDNRYKQNRGPLNKVAPIFARVLGITGGAFGGSLLKHHLMQSVGIQFGGWLSGAVGNTVASSVLATRLTSGLAGAAGGAAAGAASGALAGMFRGKREARNTQRVLEVLRTKQTLLDQTSEQTRNLTIEEQASMIKELLAGRERKIFGKTFHTERYIDIRTEDDKKAVMKILRAHFNGVARRELDAALAAVQNDNDGSYLEDPTDPGSRDQFREVNLARAFTALLTEHERGSETMKREKLDEMWIHYQGESKKEVLSHVGAGAKHGALYGAGFGAVFGFLFPANSDIAQTNAQRMINTHAIEPVMAKIHHYAEILKGGSQEAIAAAKKEAIDLAASKLSVDLGAGYQANLAGDAGHSVKESLLDLATKITESGATDEFKQRALHQLMSHSGVTAEHFKSFLEILTNPNANHIHSGGELSQLFTRGWTPEMAGKMSKDIFEWLKKEVHSKDPHFSQFNKDNLIAPFWAGGELSTFIPGAPDSIQRATEGHTLLSMFLASTAAAMTADRGDRHDVENGRGLWWWEKDQQRKAEATVHEKTVSEQEKEVKSREPQPISYNANALKLATSRGRKEVENLYGSEGLKDIEEDYLKMQGDMVRFDGRFIFKKKDPTLPESDDNIVVYRIWLSNEAGPAENQKSDVDNHNTVDDMNRQLSDPRALKGAILAGKVKVIEYSLKELYSLNAAGDIQTHPDVKGLKKGRLPAYGSNKKKVRDVPLSEILTPVGDRLNGLVIDATEVGQYAYGFNTPEWNLKVGEIPRGGISKWLKDMKNPGAATEGSAVMFEDDDSASDDSAPDEPGDDTGPAGGAPTGPAPTGGGGDTEPSGSEPTPSGSTPVTPSSPSTGPAPSGTPSTTASPVTDDEPDYGTDWLADAFDTTTKGRSTVEPATVPPTSTTEVASTTLENADTSVDQEKSHTEIITEASMTEAAWNAHPSFIELGIRALDRGLSLEGITVYIRDRARDVDSVDVQVEQDRIDIAGAIRRIDPKANSLDVLRIAQNFYVTRQGVENVAHNDASAWAARSLKYHLGRSDDLWPSSLKKYDPKRLRANPDGREFNAAIQILRKNSEGYIAEAKRILEILNWETPPPPPAPPAPVTPIAPTAPTAPEPTTPMQNNTEIVEEAALTNPNYLAKPEIKNLAISAMNYGFSREAVDKYVEQLATGFLLHAPTEERFLRIASGIKQAYPDTDDYDAIREARTDFATLFKLSTATDPEAETERYLDSYLPGGAAEYMPWPEILKDSPRDMVSDKTNAEARKKALTTLAPFVADKMARAKKISEKLGPNGL